MSGPAMLSVMTVVLMPSRRSSQAVRRAPCRKGLVSSAMTVTFLPCSTAARTTPSAEPYPAVARAPALQWASMRAVREDAFHPVYRPEQIDGSRAGARHEVAGLLELDGELSGPLRGAAL